MDELFEYLIESGEASEEQIQFLEEVADDAKKLSVVVIAPRCVSETHPELFEDELDFIAQSTIQLNTFHDALTALFLKKIRNETSINFKKAVCLDLMANVEKYKSWDNPDFDAPYVTEMLKTKEEIQKSKNYIFSPRDITEKLLSRILFTYMYTRGPIGDAFKKNEPMSAEVLEAAIKRATAVLFFFFFEYFVQEEGFSLVNAIATLCPDGYVNYPINIKEYSTLNEMSKYIPEVM